MKHSSKKCWNTSSPQSSNPPPSRPTILNIPIWLTKQTTVQKPPQTEILHQHNRFSTFNNTSDRCPIISISKCRFDYTSVPFSSMITVHCSHHTPPQTAISLSCTSHPRPSGLPLTSLTSCISEIKKQDKQQQLGTLIDYLS